MILYNIIIWSNKGIIIAKYFLTVFVQIVLLFVIVTVTYLVLLCCLNDSINITEK